VATAVALFTAEEVEMTKLWVWVEPERFVAYEAECQRDKNDDPLGEPLCVMELPEFREKSRCGANLSATGDGLGTG
jgi:hypothetical protein